MSIDKSQVGFRETEEAEVANGKPEEKTPDKPAIQLFLKSDLSVGWVTDPEQIKNIDAALHCLNSMKAALECDRDTMRQVGIHQRMTQQAMENAQLQAIARGPSYKPRRVH